MEEEQQKMKSYKVPGWAAFSGFIVVSLVLIIFLYITIFRYILVDRAIKIGDKTSAALLLTPELTTGISTLLRL